MNYELWWHFCKFNHMCGTQLESWKVSFGTRVLSDAKTKQAFNGHLP